MNVLITGACGFIGRNLIAELEGSHNLRLADAVPPAEATMFGGANGRTDAPFDTRWPFVQVDITDLPRMREACEGMDAVVHLAADPTGHAEKGKEIMANSGLTIISADDLGDAAAKVVAAVKEAA